MEVINKLLTEIKPYAKNPRRNDEAVPAVVASIRDFGFKVPIVIDKNGVIVAGHTRYKAAQQMGLERVPCIVADDLSPEKIKAYRLADNKTGELAAWDFAMLADELEELTAFDIDMSDFGFTDDIFEEENSNTVQDGETDADAVPETPEQPISEQGKVYILGKHRLMCGDSTNADDVARLMKGNKADLVFTDPPYGVSYKGTNNPNGKEWEVIENDNLRGNELYEFLKAAFLNIKSCLKEKRAFYIWYATSNHIAFESAINAAGLKSKQVLVWNKGMILGHSDYHWAYEPCFYGCHADANCEWFGDRKQTTVWDIKRDNAANYVHPTQKPTALAQKAIFNSSKNNDIVLDLFGGSGSTLIACEQTGRVNRSMEFDPKYCDVIRKRWAEFTHGEGCDWQKLTPEEKKENAG